VLENITAAPRDLRGEGTATVSGGSAGKLVPKTDEKECQVLPGGYFSPTRLKRGSKKRTRESVRQKKGKGESTKARLGKKKWQGQA